MNCCVKTDEVLRYNTVSTHNKTKHKSKRRRATSDSAQTASQAGDTPSDCDVYHPVMCSVCNSEVGVCDKEEVYHFFNVLASYA